MHLGRKDLITHPHGNQQVAKLYLVQIGIDEQFAELKVYYNPTAKSRTVLIVS